MREQRAFCWFCGTLLTNFSRRETCPHCGKDVRVCKNCVFYDPSYANACREPQAERVPDKEKANFCDYFRPRKERLTSPQEKKEELWKKAEALFKKKNSR